MVELLWSNRQVKNMEQKFKISKYPVDDIINGLDNVIDYTETVKVLQ